MMIVTRRMKTLLKKRNLKKRIKRRMMTTMRMIRKITRKE